MSNINNSIIKSLTKKHECEQKQITEVINSPFSFIRNITKTFDFTEIKTKEELEKMNTNFNIPRIGKLYANYYNIKRINDVKRSK